MNKRIKKKYKSNMYTSFTKEDKIFIKEFNMLYPICKNLNIDRLTIKRLYKYCNRYCYINKNSFEINLRLLLAYYYYNKSLKNINDKYIFKVFKILGVQFNTINNKINISWNERYLGDYSFISVAWQEHPSL